VAIIERAAVRRPDDPTLSPPAQPPAQNGVNWPPEPLADGDLAAPP